MNIKHEYHGLILGVTEDWDALIESERVSRKYWAKDGARYYEEDGWEDAYQPLPYNAIPDIELERKKRDRAERLKVKPTEVWFRPADMDYETVKKIVEHSQ